MPPDDKCILDPERDCIGKAAAALLEKRIADLEKDREKQAAFRKSPRGRRTGCPPVPDRPRSP